SNSRIRQVPGSISNWATSSPLPSPLDNSRCVRTPRWETSESCTHFRSLDRWDQAELETPAPLAIEECVRAEVGCSPAPASGAASPRPSLEGNPGPSPANQLLLLRSKIATQPSRTRDGHNGLCLVPPPMNPAGAP